MKSLYRPTSSHLEILWCALAYSMRLFRRRDAGPPVHMQPRKMPNISSAQIRAARALLNWPVRLLAEQSGISESAISRAERGEGRRSMHGRSLAAIKSTLERFGVEFWAIPASGLDQKPATVARMSAAISGTPLPRISLRSCGLPVNSRLLRFAARGRMGARLFMKFL
jgi:transcriptional regulator with XRE-family HTH domain